MSMQSNPFLRGFTQFTVTRMLLIDSGDGKGMCYRPPHFFHTELTDSQMEGAFCEFNDQFAVIPERQTLPASLSQQCSQAGFVFAVVHSITAQNGSASTHIGDAHSAAAAHEVTRQLSFDTGHYSRCWEISSKHLPPASMQWLEEFASTTPSRRPIAALFTPFEVPGTNAFGCVLHCTPWTDEHLRAVHGMDSQRLRESHERVHVPLSFMEILHQAALADTRILIFDPDAPVLKGLSLHD